MFDKELAKDCLQNISIALQTILERTKPITSADDFILSPDGMLRLDAVCMNLIAIGEAVKGLDKLTNGTLLQHYPQIYWAGVMRMRDKIAHHYFEIDPDIVFSTIRENIPQMIPVIELMLRDIDKTTGEKHSITTQIK